MINRWRECFLERESKGSRRGQPKGLNKPGDTQLTPWGASECEWHRGVDPTLRQGSKPLGSPCWPVTGGVRVRGVIFPQQTGLAT